MNPKKSIVILFFTVLLLGAMSAAEVKVTVQIQERAFAGER